MMKQNINRYLQQAKLIYQPVNLVGVDVFEGTYEGGLYAVAVCDWSLTEQLDAWQLMNMRKDLEGSLGITDVLFLLITTDANTTAASLKGDSNFWMYDCTREKLLIPQVVAQHYEPIIQAVDKARAAEHNERGSQFDYSVSRVRIFTVTNFMVVLNVLVFGIGLILRYTKDIDLDIYGALYTRVGTDTQLWRFISAMFLHADFMHIAGNMVALFFLGNYLEKTMASWKVLIIYIVGGILGNIVAYQYYLMTEPGPVSLVGASGAVFAVMGAYLYILLRNRHVLSTFTIVRYLIFLGFNIYSGATTPGVSLSAHMGGFISGLVLAVLLYRKYA